MEEKKTCIPWENGKLVVSDNGRFLMHENGEPFFWLGDTGWLLFTRLDRSEAEMYLEDRRQKGFNVIQVMVIHGANEINAYGKAALVDGDIAKPYVESEAQSGEKYDFWDHVDFIVDRAMEKGLYLALVPVWGSVVKSGAVSTESAGVYGGWLANRFRKRSNIIWIIGGDIRGDYGQEIWKTLAHAIKSKDKEHLMTFHPFGRTSSSTWFHQEDWLDFNMFQSGHRRYDQRMKKEDEDDENIRIGQDNWIYVQEDYAKVPFKPTIDGEPSYEGIPQGLHNPSEPYWTADDARRYAYWSVMAGAFGHTYGDSAVMQMHRPGMGNGAYGVKNFWYEAIHDTGAFQMKHLKSLMLSLGYFDRVPDQSIVHGDEGVRYDRLLASRGKDYFLVYTYTGRNFCINMGIIEGSTVLARWYNPRNGKYSIIGTFENSGVQEFTPPGEKRDGNDWVLVGTGIR